jgi:glycosyltransferase involved in cell wall biosynthesis
MNILLIHIRTGSGNDVFFQNLDKALSAEDGIHCTILSLPKYYEILPWLVAKKCQPQMTDDVDAVITQVELCSYLDKTQKNVIGIAHHWPGNPVLLSNLNGLKRIYYQLNLSRQFIAGVRTAQSIVCVSETTRADVSKLCANRYTDTQIITIHNGIDLERFSPSRDSAPGSNTRKRLLFVGNPSKRKGFDLLPETLRLLGEHYELTFTSGLRNAKLLEAFPSNMRALGELTDAELLVAYRSSDALMFPSRLEGFGYAAAEAMACGKPVIGVRGGTLEELLPDSLLQHQAKEHCPQQIAEAARQILAMNIDANALHEWVKTHFSLNSMAKKYIALIHSQNAK